MADEPTGALDSKSGIMVLEILQKLNEQGHTIVLVTHDPKIAAQAKRVIEIKDGEILSDTKKEKAQEKLILKNNAQREKKHLLCLKIKPLNVLR